MTAGRVQRRFGLRAVRDPGRRVAEPIGRHPGGGRGSAALDRAGKRRNHACGDALRLLEHPQQEVFGPDLLMPAGSRVLLRTYQDAAGPVGESVGDSGRPTLLGSLFGDTDRVADLAPGSALLARLVDEVPDHLVTDRAKRMGASQCLAHPIERRGVGRIVLQVADEVGEV